VKLKLRTGLKKITASKRKISKISSKSTVDIAIVVDDDKVVGEIFEFIEKIWRQNQLVGLTCSGRVLEEGDCSWL